MRNNKSSLSGLMVNLNESAANSIAIVQDFFIRLFLLKISLISSVNAYQFS